MVVNIDSRQRRDINLKGQVFVHIRQDAGIEGVQTFNDEDGVFLQFQFIAAEDAFAFGEIVSRQVHLFAVQQVMHLLAEERQVHRLDMLEVPNPILIFRRVHAVDEIVVHGQHFRPYTVH